MKADPSRMVHISVASLDGLERTAYREGWHWGVVCGAVAGACTTGLLAWLVYAVAQAWQCPAC